jgi:hypothetical protein
MTGTILEHYTDDLLIVHDVKQEVFQGRLWTLKKAIGKIEKLPRGWKGTLYATKKVFRDTYLSGAHAYMVTLYHRHLQKIERTIS